MVKADELSVPELIEAFRGPTSFGRVIGKGASTASEMKRSGSIGVEYWPAIIAAAPEFDIEGLTSDVLLMMHTQAAVREAMAQPAGANQ